MSKDIRKRTTFNNDFYNCQSDLIEEEYKSFGNRFSSSFFKIGLLGRGDLV
jgi:hypothetical protein